MEDERGIQIPAEALAPETLHNLIQEFVTRDGTEFTDSDIKIARVQVALERGTVEIWFDPTSKTCSLNKV